MNRRFVNLVTRNWTQGVYSVRRMDPYHHFFYGSTEAALGAADEACKMKESFPAMQIQDLPSPSTNFTAAAPGGTLDMFALLTPRPTSDGRMIYANTIGETRLYDADKQVHTTLGRLNTPKGVKPMCLSIAHPGGDEDSIYVLDTEPLKDARRCFEVLEPTPREFRSSSLMPPWCWRVLPPPPFVLEPWYQPSSITSFTTVVNGDGCSTIYISCGGRIGTYSFETACSDSRHCLGWRLSDKWSHVGEWKLPFNGRAQYVPEFNLWFGFSDSSPNHLCAMDLSAMDNGRQPTAPKIWEDLNLPDGEAWLPKQLELLYLGDRKFLTAKTFAEGEIGGCFSVLTGVEMIAGAGDDQHTLQMVKHKCARFVFTDEDIEWVL
ncbi:hypothetical protein CFC21_088358 [Triticum aestivum]|uniref:Uncharacterized protein n=3 Tax=Triticum TaxID=4564 RepID=A0A9R0YMP8_TRITD|nr:uncharacterized protein LOC123137429 [Triticum aestivum]XP_044413113.1 uncharacterized protein LOC123137429 [Triticum aestivum]KAF7084830.1 hypothetical protein CFC21_088358 [Triticum aestivum]VAI58347.1 unnamed protein product [Triticum turgidum subsp. durum]